MRLAAALADGSHDDFKMRRHPHFLQMFLNECGKMGIRHDSKLISASEPFEEFIYSVGVSHPFIPFLDI